jgi:uncharacterized protein
MTEGSRDPGPLERGRRLFNAGLYFEAHDAWEERWRLERGPSRVWLQGLIQIAAGCHKGLRQGNPGGCVRLLEAGLSRLDGAGSYGRLDLRGFAEGVGRLLQSARLWESGELRDFGAAFVPRLGTAKM